MDTEPELSDLDGRDLIIDLRGGSHEKCDFCGGTFPHEEIHPEEAGQWACIHCIEKWRKEGTLGY